MRSSDSAPPPEEWPALERRRFIFSFVFVAFLGVACLPVGLGFFAIGKVSALKYALIFAVFFFLIAAYSFVTRIRPGHRISDIVLTVREGVPATEIRYSQAQFVIIVSLVFCMACIFAAAMLDFSLAGPDVAAAPVAATVCGVAVVVLVSFLLMVALGRIRRGRILLSANGVHQEGRAFASFIPWGDFVGMKAACNGLVAEILLVASANAHWERNQQGGFWKIDKLPPSPMIEIDTTVVAIDRVALYNFIQFYYRNPDIRSELGYAVSVQRFRVANFE